VITVLKNKPQNIKSYKTLKKYASINTEFIRKNSAALQG
jgi:hypothetical protein